MIRFLFKGLIRDRHRSLMPFIVTATGVMLTVVFHSWITGVIGNSIEFNARFAAGHVKITTGPIQKTRLRHRTIWLFLEQIL